MSEQIPAPSLAERALSRLRKMAAGNGLEPAAISITDTQEQIFMLKGKMEVEPLCETTNLSYPGGPRGKDRRPVASFAVLQGAVTKHRQEFRANPDWAASVTQELRSHESQGWGLESAKVTLPALSAIYAATEICPSCNGQKTLTCEHCNGKGTVICTQCQGQGREPCYYCGGRGEDPQQPGQPCHTCNGTRLAPCRFCQTHGYLPCPTCGGKRGTPCATCQASGRITQEVQVTCGATSHFTLQYEGLPSGLRRGLDRIGIVNLGRGHAEITATEPPKKEDEELNEKTQIPVLLYSAALPYAEMRMDFGGKKAIVCAVGKRCAISGVPNFLDTTLKPWRDKLHLAALGQAKLEDAMEARALNDILALTVAGKDRAREIRKLYPFGLSSEALASILTDMRLALNKTTLKTRAVMAMLCGGVCAAAFYTLFGTGVEVRVARGWNRYVDLGFDLAMLAAALGASWVILNFSTRFALQRRFPHLPHALQQKIGKTGYSMLGGIAAAFVVFLLSAPVKPLWLAGFMR
jgi:hypothetical protein